MSYPDIHPYVKLDADQVGRGIPTNVNQGAFVRTVPEEEDNARTLLFMPWYVTPNPDLELSVDLLEVISPRALFLDHVETERREFHYLPNSDGTPGFKYSEFSIPGKELIIGYPLLQTPFPVPAPDVFLRLKRFDDMTMRFEFVNLIEETLMSIYPAKGFPIMTIVSETVGGGQVYFSTTGGTLTNLSTYPPNLYQKLSFDDELSSSLFASMSLIEPDKYTIQDIRRLTYENGQVRPLRNDEANADPVKNFTYNRVTKDISMTIGGIDYEVTAGGIWSPAQPPDYAHWNPGGNIKGISSSTVGVDTTQFWYGNIDDDDNVVFTHLYVKEVEKVWYIYHSVPLTFDGGNKLNFLPSAEKVTLQIMFAGVDTLVDEEIFYDHTGYFNYPIGMNCDITQDSGIHYKIERPTSLIPEKPLLWLLAPHMERLGLSFPVIDPHTIKTLQYGALKFCSLTSDDVVFDPETPPDFDNIDKLFPFPNTTQSTDMSAMINTESPLLVTKMDNWWFTDHPMRDTGKLLFQVSRMLLYADVFPNISASINNNLINRFIVFLDRSVTDTHGYLFLNEPIYKGWVPSGEEYYYEHHHLYGYWIYAIATLYRLGYSLTMPSLSSVKDILSRMVLDVCRYETDEQAVKVRNKDFYGGHSWELGLSFPWPNTETRPGEAVNCYFATMLLGKIFEEDPTKDDMSFGSYHLYRVGRYCALMEMEALNSYFRNYENQPLLGIDSPVTGELNTNGRSVLAGNSFNGAMSMIIDRQISPYTEFQYQYLFGPMSGWLNERLDRPLDTPYSLQFLLLQSIIDGTYQPLPGQSTSLPAPNSALPAILMGAASTDYISTELRKSYRDTIENVIGPVSLVTDPPSYISKSDLRYWFSNGIVYPFPFPTYIQPYTPTESVTVHKSLFDEFWFWSIIIIIMALFIGFAAAFSHRRH